MEDDETFKGEIEPPWNKKFNAVTVRLEMRRIIKAYFEKNRFNTEDSTDMAQELSRNIRDGLLYTKDRDKLNMPRHKLIVQVFLGQRKEQKVNVLAKGYWDSYVDNYAMYTYEEEEFYCTALVLGFYAD